MPDRYGPGHDLAAKEIEDLARRLSLLRQRQGHQAKANVRGYDAIDGLIGQVAKVLAQHRDGARAELIEIRPVFGEWMY